MEDAKVARNSVGVSQIITYQSVSLFAFDGKPLTGFMCIWLPVITRIYPGDYRKALQAFLLDPKGIQNPCGLKYGIKTPN